MEPHEMPETEPVSPETEPAEPSAPSPEKPPKAKRSLHLTPTQKEFLLGHKTVSRSATLLVFIVRSAVGRSRCHTGRYLQRYFDRQ